MGTDSFSSDTHPQNAIRQMNVIQIMSNSVISPYISLQQGLPIFKAYQWFTYCSKPSVFTLVKTYFEEPTLNSP